MFRPVSFRRCVAVALLSSLAAALVLLDTTQAQTAKGKKYAMLIGVNLYRHRDLTSLKYAENDVEALAELLTPASGFADVRVLTGERGEKNDKDLPTAANIKKVLAELLEDKGRHDTLLIAMSGHGVQLEVDDPDGKGKEKIFPFFCPSDADFLGVSYSTGKAKRLVNLNDLFNDLGKCGAGTKLVLLDACRNEMKAKAGTRSMDASRVTIPEGVGVLFSCARGQKAWETEDLKHGVFFHFVLEGLKGKAKNDEGVVTWADLGQFVQRQVSRQVGKLIGSGARQSPHAMGSLVGESPVVLRPDKEVVTTPKVKGIKKDSIEILSGRLERIRKARMPKITSPILFNTPEADAICSALEVFPANNPWNLVVEDWPLHLNSKNIIASIGSEKPFRAYPDMGFVLIPPDQKKVPVKIVAYPRESDRGPFPVPDNTPIEGWPVGYKGMTLDAVQRKEEKVDRHAIVVDPTNRMLYEFYQLRKTDGGWQASQASIFDLKSNKLRPDGWVSTDAAGLPVFPAIVRYDELKRGAIEHALRVTVVKTRKAYVYPATHYASRRTDENLPRMGERIRLRKDYDISGFAPEVQAILAALKKYGMFVADHGIDWAISVAPDPRIKTLHEELRKVKGSAFEVVTAPVGYQPPEE